jgi:hypothetical protein
VFTFLLIGSVTRELDIHLFVENLGVTRRERGDRYVAFGLTGMRDGWIAIEKMENGSKSFDPIELKYVKKIIRDPCFYLVEGRNGLMKYSD